MTTKSYKAKILLFGEYTIINGSHALAIPIDQFKGKWAFSKDHQSLGLQEELNAFADYLDELDKKGIALSDLDLKKFKQQLREGLYFKSNIPQGYGAGSSGALCAAVYERFSTKEIEAPENINLSNLRHKLAQLESFFHGSSSGIDPLISFINRPVLIHPDKNSIAQLPSPSGSKGAIFLLDTGIERKTEPFVKLFLEKSKDDRFAKICKEQLALYNEKAIQYFLTAQWKDFFAIAHQISLLQFEYFKEMIPTDFLAIWEQGLDGDLFKLKLCGAGGGGFILGFTKDYNQTSRAYPNEKLIPIFRF